MILISILLVLVGNFRAMGINHKLAQGVVDLTDELELVWNLRLPKLNSVTVVGRPENSTKSCLRFNMRISAKYDEIKRASTTPSSDIPNPRNLNLL